MNEVHTNASDFHLKLTNKDVFYITEIVNKGKLIFSIHLFYIRYVFKIIIGNIQGLFLIPNNN